MLKKLKSDLFSTEVQKQLSKAKVDKTHDLIQVRHINQLTNLIANPKQKNQLLNFLYQGINSSSNTLKIKSLVILHACIRKYFDEEICEVIMKHQVEQSKQNLSKDEKPTLQNFITKNCVNFYILYLKKVCIDKQSFMFIKQQNKDRLKSDPGTDHNKNLLIVTHGFKILNLINYIMQSQEMFNKMGRYYVEYEEILNMYMQILEDIEIFNAYLKGSVREIIERNKKELGHCKKGGDDKNIQSFNIILSKPRRETSQSKKDRQGTSSTKVQSSTIAMHNQSINFTAEQIQEIKHYFLYINESQKISDRFYEFSHNRYYYKIVKGIISFPTFLSIENKQYSKIKKKTKKVDQNLVHLVKMSKYDNETTYAGYHIKTQPSSGNLNNTFSHGKRLMTEGDDNSFNMSYNNFSIDFMGNEKIEQTVQQDQQY